MSNYPLPPGFLVDSGGGGGPHRSVQPPGLVPCWSPYPHPQERMRVRGKTRGCGGVSPSMVLALLSLLLLVFAALGLGAYEIHLLQRDMAGMRQEMNIQVQSPEKQVGFPEPDSHRLMPDNRPAAHVIGRAEKFPKQTLLWEPRSGRAFTEGEVVYRDGGLQVNATGLYHIYSRVQFLSKYCDPTETLRHVVFVRRQNDHKPLTLLEGSREGFCSPKQGAEPTSKGAVWTSESYLGGVLQLQKQDWVYVNVSQPHKISHNHHANFFGLYKI